MTDPNKKELLLTRVLDAPRELVWRAWTDPKLLAQWWGPNGVTNPVCEWEAVPGGNIHVVMVAGKDMGPFAGAHWPMKGTIKEIVEPSRLVFTSQAVTEDEKTMILENLCTLTLEEEQGKTKMTLHVEVTKTTPAAEGPLSGMEMGWNQSLNKLVEFVQGNK